MSKKNAKAPPVGKKQDQQKPRRHAGGMPKGHVTAKVIAKEAARDALRQIVLEEMREMTEAQIANAKGVSQFVYRDEQGRFKVIDDPDELRACIAQGRALRIFTRLPSTPAYTDLMNRAIDKPAEQVKVTGDDGGPVVHVFRWQK